MSPVRAGAREKEISIAQTQKRQMGLVALQARSGIDAAGRDAVEETMRRRRMSMKRDLGSAWGLRAEEEGHALVGSGGGRGEKGTGLHESMELTQHPRFQSYRSSACRALQPSWALAAQHVLSA
jgi:hypothetical protein